MDDPELSNGFGRWLKEYCVRFLGESDFKIESMTLDVPLQTPAFLLKAKGEHGTVAIITLTGEIHVLEVCGLIIAVAAALRAPSVETSEAQSGLRRVVLLLRQPLDGLNRMLNYLGQHDIHVQTLHLRMFRDTEGELFVIAQAADGGEDATGDDNLQNELEVFGDPLRATDCEAEEEISAGEE